MTYIFELFQITYEALWQNEMESGAVPLQETCKTQNDFCQLWYQAPDSETSLTPVFLSSTCFRPSGTAQQQLGFLNFTSGSVWKWRLQWRNSGSPIERSVAHGTLTDTPLHGNDARGAKYAAYYASVAMHTVFENIKWLHSELCQIRIVGVPSLACLFPVDMFTIHF